MTQSPSAATRRDRTTRRALVLVADGRDRRRRGVQPDPATATNDSDGAPSTTIVDDRTLAAPPVEASAYAVFDAQTSTMLATTNADARALRRQPDEAAQRGRRLRRRPAGPARSSRPTGSPAATGESVIGIGAGQVVSRSLLIRAMLKVSANDAARLLAIDIAGSEDAYATMMNDAAASLGLTNTHAVNATGLDADGPVLVGPRPDHARHRPVGERRLPPDRHGADGPVQRADDPQHQRPPRDVPGRRRHQDGTHERRRLLPPRVGDPPRPAHHRGRARVRRPTTPATRLRRRCSTGRSPWPRPGDDEPTAPERRRLGPVLAGRRAEPATGVLGHVEEHPVAVCAGAACRGARRDRPRWRGPTPRRRSTSTSGPARHRAGGGAAASGRPRWARWGCAGWSASRSLRRPAAASTSPSRRSSNTDRRRPASTRNAGTSSGPSAASDGGSPASTVARRDSGSPVSAGRPAACSSATALTRSTAARTPAWSSLANSS